MKYQSVHFTPKQFPGGFARAYLSGRAVTGTESKTQDAAVIKMVDIIDELTGIEDREMQPGDCVRHHDQLLVILKVGFTQLLVSDQIRHVTRTPKTDLFGNVKVEILAPFAFGIQKYDEYHIEGYDDITLQTDDHAIQKLVTVWK